MNLLKKINMKKLKYLIKQQKNMENILFLLFQKIMINKNSNKHNKKQNIIKNIKIQKMMKKILM